MEVFTPSLQDLLIIFAVSTVVVALFHFLRQPALAGFLLSGAIVGPYGFGWIHNLEEVNELAELGIVLLLFSLGVEFSLKSIRSMQRAFFGVGFLQCIFTTLMITFLGYGAGFGWTTSFVWGSILSLSSTAVVLKVLHQRRDIATPHGQVSVAVLLFQDLWIIPLMALLPLLNSGQSFELADPENLKVILLKALALILSVFLGAKFVVPTTLRLVARTQIRELFLIVVVLLSTGFAFLTAQLGLSLALGAFIAGVVISESEYGHQAVADIIPFRDLFMAVFFVSIGMLLDFRFFFNHLGLILFVVTAVFILKFGVTATIASILGYPSRLAALVGMILAQIGEFSFVLSNEARRHNLITLDHSQILLSATLVLMALTPLFVRGAPKIAPVLGRFDFFGKLQRKRRQEKDSTTRPIVPELKNHVVVIGYGHNGQTLAAILKKIGVPFTVIEMNHNLYHLGRRRSMPIEFGDASHFELLERAKIENSRMVVIAINDSHSIKRIATKIRQNFPNLKILARCHYIQEAESLEKIGISDLVIGEYEMSIEILARVLQEFDYPLTTIENEIKDLQSEKYRSMRQNLKS